MGIFDYDGFLIKALVKIGNMMIVSFFWLLCCIPIVTIVPATAALFHTTTKVIRQSGTGVIKDFFLSLRDSLKKGIVLSLLLVIIGFLLYTALDFGRQTWQNGMLWTMYYAFGFLLTFIFMIMVLFVPPVLSRFECSVTAALRIALYLASRNLLRSFWFLLLLGLMGLLVYIYPITLLILPGLYYDLVCGGIEKTITAFMKQSGLATDTQTSDAAASAQPALGSTQEAAETIETQESDVPEISSIELDKLLDEPANDARQTGDSNE